MSTYNITAVPHLCLSF